jgi:SAM-dependent MidA family methyltransferase
MQYKPLVSLPNPDKLSAEHSIKVAHHISSKIKSAGGQISFGEFMHEALYSQGLGYYNAGLTKFGRDGDFITAPEVSAIFGRVLAEQCNEVLNQIENGAILEFGAGSGKLSIDILLGLEEKKSLPLTYNIFEISPDLVQRQKNKLNLEIPHLVDRVKWLSAIPFNFEGVIIANEVLDALPVERFVKRKSGISQMCVSLNEDEFIWTEKRASDHLIKEVVLIEEEIERGLAYGYQSEICFAAPQWIANLESYLRYGVVFLFDYGVSRREYYAMDRNDGWLRCHYRHHAHNNPLVLPGIQDLTAWVDFSSIANAANTAGFDILGYQNQSQFLLGGGLEIEMEKIVDLPVSEKIELLNQIKTLTLPSEMGENFKCLALGKGEIILPTTFNYADRKHTL